MMVFMKEKKAKFRPGQVRDAIVHVLKTAEQPLPSRDIEQGVSQLIGKASPSSVRSYLRLNTPEMFVREARGVYQLRMDFEARSENKPEHEQAPEEARWRSCSYGKSVLFNCDCFDWLKVREDNSIHAVVTDPPYGLHEYSLEQQLKLRSGNGGVWRIPPSFDGNKRSPLPRFTTLTPSQLVDLRDFFFNWARALMPKLVFGANVLVASNPLLSHIVASALSDAGLERRGEVIRLVMTMRGGDRPKATHEEFPEVSVMPRSMWEPWLVYRKPLEARVQDNLRKWKTGGFRRPSKDRPFGDLIKSSPTRKAERQLAPHPSLKPQAFLRAIVRAALPLGEGVIVDTFAGSGSTLAAAEAVGYESIGTEKDEHYFEIACKSIPRLVALKTLDHAR